MGIFPGFTAYKQCRHTWSEIQETWGNTKSQCSQKSCCDSDRYGGRKRKKKKKIKKVGEKSLLRSKTTEKLVGEPYNYQGNGSPLTQERKREMLDLPRKCSWKAKLSLPNRGDITKCVFLSLYHWKTMMKPSNEFPLRYSSQIFLSSWAKYHKKYLYCPLQYRPVKTCTGSLGWNIHIGLLLAI